MKKKVAVIFGGQSTEHEVSRISAALVLKNINQSKYDVYPIGITKEGKWFEYTGSVEKVENGTWEQDEYYKTMDGHQFLFNKEVDVVFPVLHGLYGEDGTIQGICRLLNIPCVGAGVMSSAICMDKAYTKYLLDNFQVSQAEYIVVNENEYRENRNQVIRDIEEKLGYDVFVKPSNTGSSVGINKAHNREELIDGLLEALNYDRRVVVEKAINAREVQVGIIGNEYPKASVPGEIISSREFYDYDAKYNSQQSRFIIPAEFSEEILNEIKEEAIKVYKILDCSGMARVDFFVDKENSKIYLNELNTIPGFTTISMYPKMWQASGKNYEELIDELIELALERRNN